MSALYPLEDFFGGFAMATMVALGVVAIRQDMDIQMMCYWGLSSFVNGSFDGFACFFEILFFNLIASDDSLELSESNKKRSKLPYLFTVLMVLAAINTLIFSLNVSLIKVTGLKFTLNFLFVLLLA